MMSRYYIFYPAGIDQVLLRKAKLPGSGERLLISYRENRCLDCRHEGYEIIRLTC